MARRMKAIISVLLLSFMSMFIPNATIEVQATVGTTYYVDSTGGNDSNNGMSEGNAWGTLSAVNSRTFQPGDRILFKAGSSWIGKLQLNGSGDASNQITVDKYGTGNKPIINGNGANAAVELNKGEYWTIKNLEVTNIAPVLDIRQGILVVGKDAGITHNIQVIDCYVHDVDGTFTRFEMYQNAGILFTVSDRSSATKHFDGVLVKGCTVSNVKTAGIKINQGKDATTNGIIDAFHKNFLIQDCVISKTGTDGIIMQSTYNPVTERTQVLDAGYYGNTADTIVIAGLWMCSSDGALIQNCEVARTRKFRADGTAFDPDWGLSGTFIHQYNYTHENEGGFMLDCSDYEIQPGFEKTIARYNLSINDSEVLIQKNTEQLFEVYNNVFYNDAGNLEDIVSEGGRSNHKFYNNIFYLTRVPSWGYADYKNNLYYNPSGDMIAPLSDTNAVVADPLFVQAGAKGDGMQVADSYRLQPQSPAIDRGRVIANSGTSDFFGNSIVGVTPDIGFHEAGSGLNPIIAPEPQPEQSILTNGDFEAGGSYWTLRDSSITTDNVHSGSKALKISQQYGAAEMMVTVKPNTTYVLKGYLKATNSNEHLALGVKSYGGNEKWVDAISTNYQLEQLAFTTSDTATSAIIYIYQPSNSIGYADDIVLQEVPNIIINGDFETGGANWSLYGNCSAVTDNVHSGSGALQSQAEGAAQKWVVVKPNTTYVLKGYLKTTNSNEHIALGVKGYGGVEVAVSTNSTSYQFKELVFTTNDAPTPAKVYIYKPGNAIGYADDIVLQELPNMIVNGDFEAGGSNWTLRDSSIVTDNVHGGSGALKISQQDGAAEMTVTVKPNTTYVLKGYLKATNSNERLALGVKSYGGNEKWVDVTSTSYQYKEVEFTTGATATSAKIYIYQPGNSIGYADDIVLQER